MSLSYTPKVWFKEGVFYMGQPGEFKLFPKDLNVLLDPNPKQMLCVTYRVRKNEPKWAYLTFLISVLDSILCSWDLIVVRQWKSLLSPQMTNRIKQFPLKERLKSRPLKFRRWLLGRGNNVLKFTEREKRGKPSQTMKALICLDTSPCAAP